MLHSNLDWKLAFCARANVQLSLQTVAWVHSVGHATVVEKLYTTANYKVSIHEGMQAAKPGSITSCREFCLWLVMA